MTIKELENRTGMARANIRFYEEEGLISPKRLPNGYRDYSEEDVRTLEKIKLLRQLQLDIDTIRKVQGGALTLEQALFVQLTRLEGDRAVIERAAEVCRELERSGVEYAALEPRPWLEQMEAPQRAEIPAPPPAAPEEDGAGWEPKACYHPWMRLFARGLDMALYDTLINVLWLLVFRDQGLIRLQTANALTRWVWGLALLALTLALEPLWLHFWGWTPGKWLFGLKVRYINGEKLPLDRAWDRSWGVFRGGYGWDIPFWQIWKMWRCRELGLVGQDCDWDVEECCRYTKVGRRFSSGWAYVGAQVLLGLVLFLAALWSCLPPCRGELTVDEFARNYDHALRVQEYQGETLDPTLDEEGRWKEREQPEGTVTIPLFGDTTTEYDQPEFTLTDGRVTAVTLRMRSEDFIVSGGFQETLALEALARGGGGMHLFNVLPALGEAQKLLSRWEDIEEDLYGVHVSQRVEYTGYQYAEGSGWLVGQGEDIPRRCEKTVTISLIE